MTLPATSKPFVAIACGGTGGHLFPGLAVAGQLQARGCDVVLLISPKEVDQAAVKSVPAIKTLILPAVGLQNRNYFSFAYSFWKSWRTAGRFFKQNPPAAVLAMGGFTSAPPIFAPGLSCTSPIRFPARRTAFFPVTWMRRLSVSAKRATGSRPGRQR
jgi:UDP-N-acetylglucosamine:LPS N-acetylglucosamine transferase